MNPTGSMQAQIVDTFKEKLNELPPIMKLPVLLVMADAIKCELPRAEQEYAKAKQEMFDSFVEMLSKYAPKED